MNSDRREKLNFIFYFIRYPYVAIDFLLFAYKQRHKITNKFRRVFFKKSEDNFPPYLKDEIRNYSYNIRLDIREISSQKPQTAEYIGSIKLAKAEIKIADSIDWEQKFNDPEDYEALHRWGWLLVKLSEADDTDILKKWGKYYIYDWIKKFINQKDSSLKWATYTASERICSCLSFWQKVKLENDEIIKPALGIMAAHVLNNLEYYGEHNTFNHIINNARALYFYGQYFDNSFYSVCALKIFKNELPKLITADGFLREGSSHYHFLFTSWLLKIFELASAERDDETVSVLRPYLEKLLEKCWFFLVFDREKEKWQIPLIGDVSPDFTPEWLISVPFSDFALSVHRPNGEMVKEQDFIQAYRESGWFRLDLKDSILFLRVEPAGIPKCPGHFHNDICGFSLYHQGKPVLLDCGRFHYVLDKLGNYGLSARSHNSVQIDGFDPMPTRKAADFWKFIEKPQVSWEQNEAGGQFTVRHFGFGRICNDEILHTRNFILDSSKLIIRDDFQGHKSHIVEIFFHLAERLKLEPSKIKNQLKVTGGHEKYIIEYNLSENIALETQVGNSKLPAGWFFSEYGAQTPIQTLIYKRKAIFPLEQTYAIKWN